MREICSWGTKHPAAPTAGLASRFPIKLRAQHTPVPCGMIGAMNRAGGPLISTTGTSQSHRAAVYRRAQKDGDLIRVLPGVFIPFQELPIERDARISLFITAAAVAHRNSIVVGRSAAFLHGLARTTEEVASKDYPPIELGTVTHSSTRHTSHRWMQIEHRRVTREVERRCVTMRTPFGHIRVASMLDTCEHLLLWHPLDAAVVAVEDALNRKKLPRGALRVENLKGRKGIKQARRALNLITPWSESPRESELKLRLWRAGLPAPMQQVDIRRHTGEFLGRVDFMFHYGLIVEYDGASKHASESVDPSDVFSLERSLNRERERERRIMGLGYEFVRVDRRSFREGTGVEDVVERYADMVDNPPSKTKREKWVWSAKGKAWRE